MSRLKIWLGSAILALFVALVIAGVAASGVILMAITHTLFTVALLVVLISVTALEYERTTSKLRAAAVALLVLIIVGPLLVWLDVWLQCKKSEQDQPVMTALASNILPHILPPSWALYKTRPLARQLGTASIVKGNGNLVGNTIKGNDNKVIGRQNCASGICAGGDINGSPSINNYDSPQRHLSPEFIKEVSSCISRVKGKVGIHAPMGNTEAFTYAQDWYKIILVQINSAVLSAAGKKKAESL